MNGVQFQNGNHPNFECNWNYNYGNHLSQFPDIQHQAGHIGNLSTNCSSAANSIVVTSKAENSNKKCETENANENVRRESLESLSKGDITEEIALKVSNLLTDSNIFKTAISKLQQNSTDEVLPRSASTNVDSSAFDTEGLLKSTQSVVVR